MSELKRNCGNCGFFVREWKIKSSFNERIEKFTKKYPMLTGDEIEVLAGSWDLIPENDRIYLETGDCARRPVEGLDSGFSCLMHNTHEEAHRNIWGPEKDRTDERK